MNDGRLKRHERNIVSRKKEWNARSRGIVQLLDASSIVVFPFSLYTPSVLGRPLEAFETRLCVEDPTDPSAVGFWALNPNKQTIPQHRITVCGLDVCTRCPGGA